MRLSINLANDFQPQALDSEIKIVVNGDSFKKVFQTHLLEIEKNLVAQAASNIIENAVKYADRDTTVMISACSKREHVKKEGKKGGDVGSKTTSQLRRKN